MGDLWALRALILLACDANDACWLSLDYLVARVVARKDVVQQICDALVVQGQMQQAVVDNEPCYGVNVNAQSMVVLA
jgi:hypothetical protein